MKRRFKMNIVIDGDVDVSDEFTLEQLNKHLFDVTNDIVKEQLIYDLDIPEEIITVESRYE